MKPNPTANEHHTEKSSRTITLHAHSKILQTIPTEYMSRLASSVQRRSHRAKSCCLDVRTPEMDGYRPHAVVLSF